MLEYGKKSKMYYIIMYKHHVYILAFKLAVIPSVTRAKHFFFINIILYL